LLLLALGDGTDAGEDFTQTEAKGEVEVTPLTGSEVKREEPLEKVMDDQVETKPEMEI